jgi:branched-chain amino acid transport system substrate-binding protein
MKQVKRFSFSLMLAMAAVAFMAAGVWAAEVVIGFTGPLSGPGAGYGRDNANGLKMAVDDINARGGITIDGEKYTFKLETFDDMIDPTAAVNNARRMHSRSGARVIFNPVFNRSFGDERQKKLHITVLWAFTLIRAVRPHRRPPGD